ncbi:MAG: DegT/DnrJ/EryC1/StrS aminotransferase family protein [Deltaproteobacteria bacterium]|nr:DegT/DnrJ/EryC1/StrS aminotransferase family protein [Deltaproteobacteria bacterium]
MTLLAIDGGTPIRDRAFAVWPHFDKDEVEAASRVLLSGKVNYWTGEECIRFEKEFAAACACEFAISLANGTVALELALIGLGVGPGDEVIVPSRTFIATASSVVARGATPVIADVDADSGNLTVETITAAITPRTRAVIPVHMAGWPCDMDAILAIANEYRLYVIEDCAQAHGATYKGRPVGSFGNCAAFSFCQDKIMTTGGEGGMLVTNDETLWRRAWEYKDHGKSWDAVYRADHPKGFRWLHESFGSNFRMTEMQAAIGRQQLAKLPEWMEKRRSNVRILLNEFSGIRGLRCPWPGEAFGHACYKFYSFLNLEELGPGWDQVRIIEAINAEGVPCMAGSCSEIYREQAFVRSGLAPASPLPVAQQLSRTSLMFQVHPTLGSKDMEDMAAAVRKVMEAATI